MRKHKNIIRRKCSGALIVLLIFAQTTTSYAGWSKIGSQWKYTSENMYAVNEWKFVEGSWYRFDTKRYMITGWYYEEQKSNWYFMDPESGGMLTGWQWIDGRCYCFAATGEMYAGTVTPDGYQVNENGAWIENGIIVEIPGKGIQTIKAESRGVVGRTGNGGGGGGGGSSSGSSGGNNIDSKPEPEIPEPDAPKPDIPEPEIPDDYIPDEDEEGKVSTPSDATPSDATPSDAEMVEWQVRFVDEESHQIHVGLQRQGKIKDGENLTINYRKKIVDGQGRIWEAVEEPPLTITVYGPGKQIYYVEYIQTGVTEEGKDPFGEEKELLKQWIKTAKQRETELTGEALEDIPDGRVIATDQAGMNERLLTAAALIDDTEEHIIYVIGKNINPAGTVLKDFYREEVEYSNLQEAVITIGEDTYTVARISVTRSYNEDNCLHEWIVAEVTDATCLSRGRQRYSCSKCGMEEEVMVAALGHIDSDGDSICDRCNIRSFDQQIGDEIKADIAIEGGARKELTWICVDDDYQDGMLYVSKEALPVNIFGGYGDLEYLKSNPAHYFSSGWQNAFSIAGDPLLLIAAGGSEGYAAILDKEEAERYLAEMGGSYLTRTVSEDGAALVAIKEDGTVETVSPDLGGYGIRPAVLLKKQDAGTAEKVHWNIGDVQARDIDGKTYLFRCIDQNYADKTETHRQAALFLCDSVIPANTGSRYIYEKLPDGTYGYVFQPGPIVNFGTANDYKYSRIRKWLQKSEGNFYNTEPINIGVSYAYTGSTEEGKYSQLKESSLSASYIGSQKMTGKLFILSVDEALKYKDWLWRFDGSESENPESQYGAFSRGYWLRNAMGTSRDYDTGYVYAVDLVQGNIHPVAIQPDATDDDEINVTGSTGVRPVFTMPQD